MFPSYSLSCSCVQTSYPRADPESARVGANREFFDNFNDTVENDAVWAYKLHREYNRKIKYPDYSQVGDIHGFGYSDPFW
jgi:hypothetical protein